MTAPLPGRESLLPARDEPPPPTHRLTATFIDPALETAFRAEHFELSVRRFVQFSVLLVSAAFLLFGVHDAILVPSVLRAAWTIRYALFLPCALALIAFTQSRFFTARSHAAVALAIGASTCVPVAWIGAIAPTAGYFVYTGYLVPFVAIGPLIGRMNVATQVVYTVAVIALYHAFDLGIAHATLPVRTSFDLTLLALGGLGALAAYVNELQARESFLQRRKIRAQFDALASERARSDLLLLNVLPAPIAERLKRGQHPIADGFAEVTVLFSDIVGFTPLSARLSPDELVRRLDDVFTRFDAMAGELGLEKIKTIGDAYMVVGGLPLARPDHVEAVAEMALRMIRAVGEVSAELGETIDIRVGMHIGPVVAGVIGSRKFIYDVWGDTVNVASRMESHGEPGRIHVSSEVRARLAERYRFEERGAIAVKGRGTMTTHYLFAKDAA